MNTETFEFEFFSNDLIRYRFMQISEQELHKIESLLESSDTVNVQLGLQILSGFTLNTSGIYWLFEYYQRLAEEEAKQQPSYNLQALLTGSPHSAPTKASQVLTLLLEKADNATKIRLYQRFIQHQTLTLPRLELTCFPIEILTFSTLENIKWQFGLLEIVPESLLQLKNLKSLDLRHQPLKTIEEAIINHPTLEEIWINNALIITEDLADNAKFDILIEAAY